jgi:hypothetical protein
MESDRKRRHGLIFLETLKADELPQGEASGTPYAN